MTPEAMARELHSAFRRKAQESSSESPLPWDQVWNSLIVACEEVMCKLVREARTSAMDEAADLVVRQFEHYGLSIMTQAASLARQLRQRAQEVQT